ncbi:MAG: TetR/AcrR family transcriptional regulator [Oscillospiraceae bacterium]|nr:TetR/AcrR family transcriptional regulator [Oscillospiraceae bacterium]
MPKIIENPQERMIAEARRQIAENGYSAVTIRSVAAGCGVGVGTVYNYFSSKDDLTAAFMLEDWKKCIASIHAVSMYSESHKPVVRCIYDQLKAYALQHQMIFQDESARPAFAGSFSRYHKVLRSQLAEPLQKFCDSEFAAAFIAESLLTWTMAGKEFDEIYIVLQKLFKE